MVYNSSLLSVTGDTNSQLLLKLTNTSLPIILTGWCSSGTGKTTWLDFNRDGKADIVCDAFAGSHHLLLNYGDSLLSMTGDANSALLMRITPGAKPQPFSQWCVSSRGTTTWADFNGDGRPDLVCDTFAGSHYVLLNDKDALLSITGDGNSQLPVRLTRSSLPIQLPPWCASSYGKTSWVDFNGDGKPDLICDGATGAHHLLLNDGNSLLSITGDSNSQLSVRMSHDSAPIPLTDWCPSSYGKTSWVDFNGDGKPDLICDGITSGAHHVLLNDGDALLSMTGNKNSQLSVKLTPGASPTVLTSWCPSSFGKVSWGDFNGDDKADLICDGTVGGTHHVLLNDGDAMLSMASSSADSRLGVRISQGATSIALTNWCLPNSGKASWIDFNKDGKKDLVCDQFDGTHHVLLNDGDALLSITGDISSQLLVRLTYDASSIQLKGWCGDSGNKTTWADFNNDGKPDLMCDAVFGTHLALLNAKVVTPSPTTAPTPAPTSVQNYAMTSKSKFFVPMNKTDDTGFVTINPIGK